VSFVERHQSLGVVYDASLEPAHGLIMRLALRHLAVIAAAPVAVRPFVIIFPTPTLSQAAGASGSGLPLHSIGHMHDDTTLALVYGAADVMTAVPSRHAQLGGRARARILHLWSPEVVVLP